MGHLHAYCTYNYNKHLHMLIVVVQCLAALKLVPPPPPPRVSPLWRMRCAAWLWACGSASAVWAAGALRWGRWCSRCRGNATPNTSSAWRWETTWTPWAAWCSSTSCSPRGETHTQTENNLLTFIIIQRKKVLRVTVTLHFRVHFSHFITQVKHLFYKLKLFWNVYCVLDWSYLRFTLYTMTFEWYF